MILKDLLANRPPDATALAAPERAAMSYGTFLGLCEATAQSLNRLGLGRNDRLAMVLPNGPEMAACFVACASAVTAAPLNPAYREDEFHFYMEDLKANTCPTLIFLPIEDFLRIMEVLTPTSHHRKHGNKLPKHKPIRPTMLRKITQ